MRDFLSSLFGFGILFFYIIKENYQTGKSQTDVSRCGIKEKGVWDFKTGHFPQGNPKQAEMLYNGKEINA
jgi:hypothetical protein